MIREESKKDHYPSGQLASLAYQEQPFVYHGMPLQHVMRLMREGCTLRHLSINTEKHLHLLDCSLRLLPQVPKAQSSDLGKMEAFLPQSVLTGISASTQNQTFNASLSGCP